MLSENLVSKFKEKYPLHPLIFHRSLSKAKSDAELFDILDSFPGLPCVWSEEEGRWLSTEDPFLFSEFIL